jgi:hypothetical protein
MICIIAGGRDYSFTPSDIVLLDKILEEYGMTEIVSGCARGADTCGERWAVTHNLPVKQFPADWKKHGRVAGPIRNEEMAKYANMVILFPGGTGTNHMFKMAKKYRLHIIDLREKTYDIQTFL